MSSPFPHKSVYHSSLVKESPIEVTITCSEPKESKYPNKPPYIAFKVDGGDEHYYECENNECAEALTGLKGETGTIVASGRGEDARIEWQGGGRQPSREQRREEPRGGSRQNSRPPDNRQPAAEQRREAPEDRKAKELATFKKAKVLSGRAAVLMGLCLRHSAKLCEEHLSLGDGTYDPEHQRTIAVTLFIETSRGIAIGDMPLAFIDLKAAHQPPAREQERQPERRRDEPPPPPQRQPDGDEALDDIPW